MNPEETLDDQLAAEEQRGPLTSLAELALRSAQRRAIQEHLVSWERSLQGYQRRFEHLPALPDRSCFQWAQHLLNYPNGRLLTIDSLYTGESAVLLQMHVMDLWGRVRWQHCVADVPLSLPDLRQWGISAHDAQHAVALPVIWPELLEELRGCYLLVCGLRQARLLLEQEAQRFHLEPVVMIGDDLLAWCTRFFQATGRSSLAGFCAQIGHPLPDGASITERAYGQLALLEAMAHGITGVVPEEDTTGPVVP